MQRTRNSRIQINATCEPVDTSILNNLQTDLAQLQSMELSLQSILPQMINLSENSSCKLSEMYPVVYYTNQFNVLEQFASTYTNTEYCERIFYKITVTKIEAKLTMLESQIITLSDAVLAEQNTVKEYEAAHLACLAAETSSFEAGTDYAAETSILVTEETALTKAQTEQQILIAEATKSPYEKYLPYAAAAVGIYFLAFKKK